MGGDMGAATLANSEELNYNENDDRTLNRSGDDDSVILEHDGDTSDSMWSGDSSCSEYYGSEVGSFIEDESLEADSDAEYVNIAALEQYDSDLDSLAEDSDADSVIDPDSISDDSVDDALDEGDPDGSSKSSSEPKCDAANVDLAHRLRSCCR